MSNKKTEIKLASNETLLKKWNYADNSKVIVTDQRVISHVASANSFEREEMPIKDVHSITTHYVCKRKGAVPGFILFIVGLIVAAIGGAYYFADKIGLGDFVAGLNLAEKLAKFVNILSIIFLAAGAVMLLIGIILLLVSIKKHRSISLNIRVAAPLTDCLTLSATDIVPTRRERKKMAQNGLKCSDITIRTRVTKESLKMVNEIGAFILDVKNGACDNENDCDCAEETVEVAKTEKKSKKKSKTTVEDVIDSTPIEAPEEKDETAEGFDFTDLNI